MKALIEVALQSHNLPLTCLVGLCMLYWIVCMLGVIGADAIDLDIDADFDSSGEIDADGTGSFFGGALAAFLRFVNAFDVPVMAVLSFLAVFTWLLSMMGNYYFNPALSGSLIAWIFVGAVVGGILLTKATTAPMVPLFRKLKELEKSQPAVGGVGVVVSKQVDNDYGQVEQKRDKGAPAILNCWTTRDEPISRGTEVAIIDYDPRKNRYLVRAL